MARVFQFFSGFITLSEGISDLRKSLAIFTLTYPFLAVRVLQVIDSFRVPPLAQTKQKVRLETRLCHDDKVREKARSCLNHADLAIGHGDESFVDQFVFLWIPRLTLHDVAFGLFV